MVEEFKADLSYQLREDPELFLVLDELLLYARRDPETNRVLTGVIAFWQQSLTSLFEQEIAQGRFRADLDAKSAVLTVISFCQGISLLLTAHSGDVDVLLHIYLLF